MTQPESKHHCASTCHCSGHLVTSYWLEQVAQAALLRCGVPPRGLGAGAGTVAAVGQLSTLRATFCRLVSQVSDSGTGSLLTFFRSPDSVDFPDINNKFVSHVGTLVLHIAVWICSDLRLRGQNR